MFKLLQFLFDKLFKINDTPQKIALGFGLGVFAGIFPGTGPVAAILLAYVFRANRASALFGSLFTNTWLNSVSIQRRLVLNQPKSLLRLLPIILRLMEFTINCKLIH